MSTNAGRTKSDLFRETFRRYLQEQRWAALRGYGVQQARKLGAKETDIERLIAEYRKGR
jgi:hypothetical protein